MAVDFRGHPMFAPGFNSPKRLMAERRARKRLWGVYRNHFTDDPSDANIDRGAANTHIYWHMLVLKEDSLRLHVARLEIHRAVRETERADARTATASSSRPWLPPTYRFLCA